MLLDLIRILLLLAITLAYALFDIFNKRNVPDLFAYVSVAVGLAITLTYSHSTILFSLMIAAVIAAISYFLYRAGQLGAGDGFEFVAISLIMPLQGSAAIVSASQFSMPFILSAFVATGVIAVWVAPIYYLSIRKKSRLAVSGNDILKGASVFLSYMILLLLFVYLFGFRYMSALIILIIGVPSAFIAIYARRINERMVEPVYPNKLEPGDMIAINLMSDADIKFFSRRSEHFGRLVTKRLINDIKRAKKTLPVYRRALPLAAIIFFGVVASLLFGDILLLLI